MIKRVSLLLVMALTCHLSFAAAESGASVAMTEYFDALKAGDAQKMTRLMHPDALTRLRDVFSRAFNGPNGEQAQADFLGLFSVDSLEAFNTLDDQDVFERMWNGTLNAAPQLLDIMGEARFELLGQVSDGEEVMVNYRLTMQVEGQVVSDEVVQRVKQHDGRWYLLLPATAEASIALVESRY